VGSKLKRGPHCKHAGGGKKKHAIPEMRTRVKRLREVKKKEKKKKKGGVEKNGQVPLESQTIIGRAGGPHSPLNRTSLYARRSLIVRKIRKLDKEEKAENPKKNALVPYYQKNKKSKQSATVRKKRARTHAKRKKWEIRRAGH